MVAPEPIRILIVDDHPIVRAGLVMVVQAFNEFQLVGEASNGLEAVQLCTQLQPDVILMDLKMPEMDGLAATRLIHKMQPEIQVIVLTSQSEDDMALEVLNAGASACLSKDVSVTELRQSIHEISSKQHI